jgi:hypothetical protein
MNSILKFGLLSVATVLLRIIIIIIISIYIHCSIESKFKRIKVANVADVTTDIADTEVAEDDYYYYYFFIFIEVV